MHEKGDENCQHRRAHESDFVFLKGMGSYIAQLLPSSVLYTWITFQVRLHMHR